MNTPRTHRFVAFTMSPLATLVIFSGVDSHTTASGWNTCAAPSPGRRYRTSGCSGTSFMTAPDGRLYQLPDQHFANLCRFRADLFARKDLQDKFKGAARADAPRPLCLAATATDCSATFDRAPQGLAGIARRDEAVLPASI